MSKFNLDINLTLLLPALLAFTVLIIHCYLYRGLRLTLTFFGSAFICYLTREITLQLMDKLYGKLPYKVMGFPIRIFQFPLIVYIGWAMTFYLSWCLAERILNRLGNFSNKIFPTVIWSALVAGSISYCVETTAIRIGWWRWTFFDTRFNYYLVAPLSSLKVWFGFASYFLLIFLLSECSKYRKQWWRAILYFFVIDSIIGGIFVYKKDFNPYARIYEIIRILIPVILMFIFHLELKYGYLDTKNSKRYLFLYKAIPNFVLIFILSVCIFIDINILKRPDLLVSALPLIILILFSLKMFPIMLTFILGDLILLYGGMKTYILAIPLGIFGIFWFFAVYRKFVIFYKIVKDKIINLSILRDNRLYPISFFFILLIGFALRIFTLGKYSLWFDEAASLLNAENLRVMITKLGKLEFNYPSILYGFFIYCWQWLGKNEAILRLSSVILAIFTIAGVYNLGKTLFDKKTALLSSFLLAVSPFHIYYSRELRMYSMMTLLSVLSIYFLIKALNEGKIKFWVGYTISNTLNIYTHFSALYILLAEVILFFIYYKKYGHFVKKWLFFHFLIFLSVIPWLINIIFLLKNILSGNHYPWMPGWLADVSLKNIFYVFANFGAGYNATMAIYIVITILFFILIILGVIKTERKEATVLLLCFLFIPVLSMFLFSKFKPWFMDRYVVPSSIFYYLLIAQGLRKVKPRYISAVLGIPIIFISIGLNNYYLEYFPCGFKNCSGAVGKKDYRGASNYIMNNFRKGDVIFHTSRSSTFPFEYYLGIRETNEPNKSKEMFADVNKRLLLCFTEKTDELLPFEYMEEGAKYIDRSSDISVKDRERIWLVYSGWFFKHTLMPDSDESRKLRCLEKYYVIKDAKIFREIVIFLYEKKKIM